MKTERQDGNGEFSFLQETPDRIFYEMFIELPSLGGHRYIVVRVAYNKITKKSRFDCYYDAEQLWEEDGIDYDVFSEITGHLRTKNIAFDCCASLDTHKDFDKLTVPEFVEAMRERLDVIEKENNIEAFGFVDSHDHD